MISPLDVIRRGDIDRVYLERINALQAEHINQLKAQLEFSKSLIARPAPRKSEVDIEDWQPVGGFKSTRQRIAEAELKAKEDADKNKQAVGQDAVSSS